MKIVKTVYFVFFLMLINVCSVIASPQSGPSTPTTNAEEVDPPPGGPIDENILVLTISALVLGSVVIYKNKTQKASV